MNEQIKQPGTVPLVTPPNPARNSGRRKTPQKRPPKPSVGGRRQPPSDDKPHHVDEYV